MITISDEYDDQAKGNRRTLKIGKATIPWPFPIASMLRSGCAVVLGWPVYGAKAPSYIRYAHNWFTKVYEAKLWVWYRIHPGHRYHVVNTGLEPGYYDVDTIMLHACMTLLCRYIEDECGGAEKLAEWTAELKQPGSEGHGPREVIDNQASKQAEAVAIYYWWKVEKPADEDRRDELMHKLYGGKSCEVSEINMGAEFRRLKKKIDDDEQSYLHRLIEIRQGLWT